MTDSPTGRLLETAVAHHQRGQFAQAQALYEQVLGLEPKQPDALHLLGVLARQQGRADEAVSLIGRAISLRPWMSIAHHNLGIALLALQRPQEALASFERAIELEPGYADALVRRGQLLRTLERREEALASVERAMALEPGHFDAWNQRGNTLMDLNRPQEALASYDQAIALNPDRAETFSNRGVALRTLKRPAEALASCDEALMRDPGHADALVNRGLVLTDLGRLDEALDSHDRALALKPDHADALVSRGNALRDLKRVREAIDSYEMAIALRPRHADTHVNLGAALRELGRAEEALASYDRAIALRPNHAAAFGNRGNALLELKRPQEAVSSYGRALHLNPAQADLLTNRGDALRELGRLQEALASFDQAIALKPDYADAFSSRGNALRSLGRPQDALASYDRAAALEPSRLQTQGDAAHTSSLLCRWSDLPQRLAAIAKALGGGQPVTASWPLLALVDDPLLHRQAAQAWARERVTASGLLGPLPARPRGPRIHVAYLSADFHDHATTRLLAELLELHDRRRFELTGISFGPHTDDAMQLRVSAALDRFIDVRERSDLDVARLCRELGVDIAVDLKGYTQDCRPGILAEGCAPVQVNWLGYPGTMGAPFIDYIVADPVVITEADLEHYSEKVIWLPHSYQPNDSKRPVALQTPSRADCSLPAHGFVFACFNAAYKIQPEVFSVWMRLLQRVPGSVLWLLQANPEASANLRREAAARGVDPGRVVFAQKLPLAEHLARHRLADLFVDTWPCNAHTTASDALWAGLPVLTCRGRSFAARVAASLLHAIGLPELVTHSREEYEELAVALAADPARLSALRARLQAHRSTWPLFDCARLTRHLEAAYEQAMRIAGQPPANIRIEDAAAPACQAR